MKTYQEFSEGLGLKHRTPLHIRTNNKHTSGNESPSARKEYDFVVDGLLITLIMDVKIDSRTGILGSVLSFTVNDDFEKGDRKVALKTYNKIIGGCIKIAFKGLHGFYKKHKHQVTKVVVSFIGSTDKLSKIYDKSFRRPELKSFLAKKGFEVSNIGASRGGYVDIEGMFR